MNFTKRLLTASAVAATVAGLGATAAHADSIAYIKGGDVYLTTPDGSKQFQVTSGGGYIGVSQANDGTLLATTNTDNHLRRLDRYGKVLSDIATPVSDHSTGSIRTFQGPFDADISPDGSKVGYGYIEAGFFTDTSGNLSSETRNGAGFTKPDQLTGFTDDGFKHINDWDAPEFVDNTHVLLSNGPVDPYDDTIAVGEVGSMNPVNWFSDAAVPHPMEASISRNNRVIAVVNGVERKQLYIYHDTDGKLGKTAGQPMNVEACFTYADSGLASPTFNADGSKGFWTSDKGIQVANFNMAADCGTAQDTTTIAPGGSSPDWGPADLPAPRPDLPQQPKPTPTPVNPIPTPTPAPALAASIKKIALKLAVKNGLTVSVNGSGKVSAKATMNGKPVASGTAAAGATQVKLRFTAAAKRKLNKAKKAALVVTVNRDNTTATSRVTLAR